MKKALWWWIVALIVAYPTVAIFYHFVLFGRLGGGYRLYDGGDYYVEIYKSTKEEGRLVVPAKIVAYQSTGDYILAVRKVIDVFEYRRGYDDEKPGALEFYLIDKRRHELQRFTECTPAVSHIRKIRLELESETAEYLQQCSAT